MSDTTTVVRPSTARPDAGAVPATLPAAVFAALDAGAETPAYVYDLARVRENAARLRGALPEPADLYYSLKANSHPGVLRTLREAGVLPEVCSPGELDAALGAGWDAGQVLYTGPGKRDQDIDRALEKGVREFCADSPTGLDQLDRLAGRAGVRVRTLLRVNDDRPAAGQGLAMTGVASQFGADTRWITDESERFGDRPHVEVTGLHLYMGTNLTHVPDLLAQFRQSLTTAARLRAVLAPHTARLDTTLDLGGGFGAPFAKEGEAADLTGLREGLAELLDACAPGWRDGAPRPAYESGRHLVGTAGTLLTRVLDVKRSHGRDVAVLESGINHLGGMAGLRRLPPLNPTLLTGAAGRGEPRPTMVTGPLCTPLDTWARQAPLPPLRPGDLLAVPNVGAYGLSASLLAFLGHPAPLEVAVDGSAAPHITRLTLTRKD
ncbi:type III PLP-dependent enzyme [Streptomyces sp. NPDC003011]